MGENYARAMSRIDKLSQHVTVLRCPPRIGAGQALYPLTSFQNVLDA